MTRKSLRQGFGMVLQDIWLKSGTIRENIVMGKPDATEEEIINACAHSYGFIKRMSNGLTTVIGEMAEAFRRGRSSFYVLQELCLQSRQCLFLMRLHLLLIQEQKQRQNAFAKLMEKNKLYRSSTDFQPSSLRMLFLL